MTDTEAGFAQTLDADPFDWCARLIYADWLIDEGRADEAAAQRWMARWRRTPTPTLTDDHFTVWDFWSTTNISQQLEQSKLPGGIYLRLSVPVKYGYRARWDTRAEAEADLARVLAEVGYDAADELMRECEFSQSKMV